MKMSANPTIAQMFNPVKPASSGTSSPSSDSMIHHKVPGDGILKRRIIYRGGIDKRYGVSKTYRVLSPGLLLKKFDYIRDCLVNVLDLSPGQVEITLKLLRLWAYYGAVYPKERQVTERADDSPVPTTWSSWYAHSSQSWPRGCSKATFWRTIRLLEDMRLLTRINRFVLRPHAQISNLYRLDRLIVVLAKYLSEHIAHVWDKWLQPYLSTPWPRLWDVLARTPEARAGPLILASEGL